MNRNKLKDVVDDTLYNARPVLLDNEGLSTRIMKAVDEYADVIRAERDEAIRLLRRAVVIVDGQFEGKRLAMDIDALLAKHREEPNGC